MKILLSIGLACSLLAQETIDHRQAQRVTPWPVRSTFPGSAKVGDHFTYTGGGSAVDYVYDGSNWIAAGGGGGAVVPAAGIVKSNGTVLQSAVAGTDYQSAIPTNTYAPYNASGYTTPAQAAAASPVQSVNGLTGAVVAVSTGAVALTDAATITTNAALGNHFRVTLGGNRTLATPTNPTDGQKATWEFIQDASGGRTVTLSAAFAFGTDVTGCALTTTAAKRDFIGAIYNASTSLWYVVSCAKGY